LIFRRGHGTAQEKERASFMKKEAKNFLNWAVLVSAPQAQRKKIFAPLFLSDRTPVGSTSARS
jgi:hypothetical protein